jgi:hypothetical protein
MNRQMSAGAVICGASWLIAYAITSALTSGMSAAPAYATITSWWFALYISAKTEIPILSAVYLFVGYYILFCIAALSGASWLYRDVGSVPVVSVFEIGIVQAAIVSSPIVIDGVSRAVMSRYRRKR